MCEAPDIAVLRRRHAYVYFTSIRRPEDATENCDDVVSKRVEVAGVAVPEFRTAQRLKAREFTR